MAEAPKDTGLLEAARLNLAELTDHNRNVPRCKNSDREPGTAGFIGV